MLIPVILAIAFSASPPRVVAAIPDNADTGVDPALTELRITFDQDMATGGRSICGGGPSFPKITGAPRWEDGRTIIVPVALEPDTRYSLSINCPAASNFRSASGVPADVYPISFRTGKPGDPPATLAPDEARAMGAALRKAIDERYAHRDVRAIDWDKRFGEFRSRLEGAATPGAFARAASDLLRATDDLHVYVETGGMRLAGGRRAVDPNCDPRRLEKFVPHLARSGSVLTGRFDDGIGYIAIPQWSGDDAQLLAPALKALVDFHDAPGLIVDVRLNSGGDETLARRFAANFVEKTTVYSTNLIRDPSSPGGWAGPFERTVEPAPGAARFVRRVAVLMGPECMSSCESFLLMMRRPRTRELFGEESWGSSGNPKPVDLGHGVTVYLASWKDMTADGTPIEARGISPDHAVEWTPAGGTDPVLDAGLDWLRKPAP